MSTRLVMMRLPFLLAVGAAGLFAMLVIGVFAVVVLLALLPPATTVTAGILEVTAATISLYVLSKAFQQLSKRRPGYHDDEATPVQSRRIPEPVLLGIAFALATFVVTYCSWWNHRLASREYAHSKGCYAQLQTADRVPGLGAKFAPAYLQYKSASYLGVAEEHGAKLGMRRGAVDQDLRQAAAADLTSYARLTPAAAERTGRVLTDDVTRCANDDWAPHGELLNP